MTDYLDILVIFTDDTSKLFSVESTVTVKLLKEVVAQSIDLKYEIHFGFFSKDRDARYWLSDDKTLISHDYFYQMHTNIKLHFVIKHFYEIQNLVSDKVVKYYLYHQLRDWLYSGNVECDGNQCFELLAMTLYLDQYKFDSFCEPTNKMGIIPLHLFAKHPSIEHCSVKIEEKYKELVRNNDDDLMQKFIDLIFQLPTKITHYFLCKDFNSSAITIGINQHGFVECNTNSKSSYRLTYKWSEIINISSRNSKISIDIDDHHQKSSIRRESCTNNASYELIHSHLAKSIVYLARDTIAFISMYNNSTDATFKFPQYKNERRNIAHIKKLNSSTITSKAEKCTIHVSEISAPDDAVEFTRSLSHISLSSSIYNESCLTNDSISLQFDEDSVLFNLSLQELKIKFNQLYSKKNELQTLLNQKQKEAIELLKEEFAMTCKIPSDHKLLDPLGEVCFTNNPLPSRLLSPENQSDYHNEKNRLLLEIETITNIYEVLRKMPKSEKRLKKELEVKKKEINNIKNKLNVLEIERAAELGSLREFRSISMGHLNRISSRPSDDNLANESLSDLGTSQIEMIPSYNGRLTEPIQRKFKPSEISAAHALDFNYCVPMDSDNTISDTLYFKKQGLNRPVLYSDPNHINTTNFQRFASVRTTIKIPSSERVKTFHSKTENDVSSSSRSSTSRSSINDDIITDVTSMFNSTNSHREAESLKNNHVALRQSSTVSCRIHNCRDSMEINNVRLNHIDSNYSQRIISKSNKQNRKSVSLEDVREEVSNASIKYLPSRERRKLSESITRSINYRITYRPSIKDCKPTNITRGKQPSIIKKKKSK